MPLASTMRRPHNKTGRQRWAADFQQPVISFSEDGKRTPSTAWLTFIRNVWVELTDPVPSKPQWRQQVQYEQLYTIYCRWFPGLRQRMRMVIGNRIFNIVGVNDVNGLHHEWIITAAEINPQI